jgi:hypothetical protein
MTPFITRYASEEILQLFNRIRKIIIELPDLDFGKDLHGERVLLSCHMLARAVGRVLNLSWTDGLYAELYAHSWLHTPDHNWIVDCYPIRTVGGPLLIDASSNWLAPGHALYVAAPHHKLGKNILFSSNEFRRSVRLLEREIRKINTSLL